MHRRSYMAYRQIRNLEQGVFGAWTVLRYSHWVRKPDKNRRHFWICTCHCGTVRPVQHEKLIGKRSFSCGCQKSENLRQKATKHGDNARYGAGVTPEYRSWTHAKGRCYNPTDANYSDYGGRGIRMYPEWVDSYPAFLAYLGRKPSVTHSLDRFPNNDGDYAPGNVRWATPSEQNYNQRKRRKKRT